MPNPSTYVNCNGGGAITHSEMQGLLQPLQSSIERLEKFLVQLSGVALLPAELREMTTSSFKSAAQASDPGIGKSESSISPTSPKSFQMQCASKPVNVPGETQDSIVQSRLLQGVDSSEALSTKSGVIENGSKMGLQGNTPESPEHMPSIRGTVTSSPSGVLFREMIEEHKIARAFEPLRDRAESSIADRVVSSLETCGARWHGIKEPKRDHPVFRFITSHRFETACQIAIVLNSGLVAYVADWQIRHIGTPEPLSLEILESCFVAFFLVELVLRLGTHRFYFFVNNDMQWNIFDFILVTISLVDFVLARAVSSTSSSNLGFMRLMRLLKLARIFRFLRLFRFFKGLTQMLDSFYSSLIALFWGFIMLSFVLYLFALVFIQGLVGYLNTGGAEDSETRKGMILRFGSLGDTVLSLYMSITGGEDWRIYYDILWEVGEIYGILFALFNFLASFALFNIITGLLVEKAMTSAKPDRTDRILNHRRRSTEDKRVFLEICRSIDRDNNGRVSWEEFQEWAGNPVFIAYLASVGIDIHDVELFFETVGSRVESGHMKRGEVTFEHFVNGCMHMKGSATALDMQRQLFEMEMLHHDIKQFEIASTNQLQHLEQLVDNGFKLLQLVMPNLKREYTL